MKIILLGLLFCDDSLKSAMKYSKCGVQFAPHKFQSNLLKGFYGMDGVDISVINIPPTGSFPIHSKEIYSREYVWGDSNKQISYINLPFIKHTIQRYKVIYHVEKIINSTNEPVNIIVYSSYEPFLDVIITLKKKYQDVQTCLIQTDPVLGRGDMARYMTTKAVRKGNRIVKKVKFIDKFVLLTKYLAETLEVGNRPFIVIECISDDTQVMSATSSAQRNVFLYTGTLDSEFGIVDLAEAFTYLPDAEFWIYGSGNAEKQIREIAQHSSNIKFFGFADQDTLKKARDDCSFLINPRRPTGTYTKYSFPSKTAEYLMTGKPTIMYKLEGIPDSYDPYINYLNSDNVKGIAEELKKYMAIPYSQLLKKAHEARKFMLENTSPKVQAQKIVYLLSKRNM